MKLHPRLGDVPKHASDFVSRKNLDRNLQACGQQNGSIVYGTPQVQHNGPDRVVFENRVGVSDNREQGVKRIRRFSSTKSRMSSVRRRNSDISCAASLLSLSFSLYRSRRYIRHLEHRKRQFRVAVDYFTPQTGYYGTFEKLTSCSLRLAISGCLPPRIMPDRRATEKRKVDRAT